MAENTILSGLRNPGVEHVGDVFEDQIRIDFTGAEHTPSGGSDTGFTLTSGDYFKAFNIPKGGLITEFGWLTHTTDAGNPKFKTDLVDSTTGTSAVLAATAIGAVGAWTGAQLTSGEAALAADAYVKITGSVANCDDGVVTFFIKGIVVKNVS